MQLELIIEQGRFAVCRLGPMEMVPEWTSKQGFTSITRTQDELSVVCAEVVVPAEVKCERGWRMLRVKGTQAFTLTGVLSSVLEPLAAARISIFAISTFDTDYVLVKAEMLEKAKEVLSRAGHKVIE